MSDTPKYPVESVEWGHQTTDVAEGTTRITVKGTVAQVGAGDTITYHPATPPCRCIEESGYPCRECAEDEPTPPTGAKEEPTYPCEKCGKLRTKAQGGTTFTVCDTCWDETYKRPAPVDGLNFDIPEKRLGIEIMDIDDYDPQKRTEPGTQPAWLTAYEAALNAQHLAALEGVRKENERLASLLRHASMTHFPPDCAMCAAILAMRKEAE